MNSKDALEFSFKLIDEVTGTADRMTESVKHTAEQVTRLDTSADTVRMRLDILKDGLTETERQSERTADGLGTVSRSADGLDAVTDAVERVGTMADTTVARVGAMGDALGTAETDMGRRSARISDAVGDVVARIDTMSDRITAIGPDSDMAVLESDAVALTDALESIPGIDLSPQRAEVQSLKDMLADIPSVDLSDLDRALADTRARLQEGLAVDVTPQIEEVERLADAVSSIPMPDTSSIDTAVDRMGRAEDAASRVRASVSETVPDLERLDVRIGQTVTDADGLAGKVSDLRSRTDRAVDGLRAHDTQSKQTERTADRTTTALDRERSSAVSAEASLQSARIEAIQTMMTISSMGGAVGALQNGLTSLGLISEDTASKLSMVGGAFNVIKGTAEGLAAVRSIMVGLNLQMGINAQLSTYLAALKNPAMLAVAGAAAGAAIGIGASYFMTDNRQNNSQTNITITDTNTSSQSALDRVYRIVDGGAL